MATRINTRPITSQEQTEGIKVFIDFTKKITRAVIDVVAYNVALLYSVCIIISTKNGFLYDTRGATIISLVITISLTLALLGHWSRPKSDLANPKYRMFFKIALISNTFLGIGACLYTIQFLHLYPIPLPTAGTLSLLYRIVTIIVTVLAFPLTLVFYTLPVFLFVNFLAEKFFNKSKSNTETDRTALERKKGGATLIIVFIACAITVQHFDTILELIIKYMPSLVGSIPLYWIYFFIVTPLYSAIKYLRNTPDSMNTTE